MNTLVIVLIAAVCLIAGYTFYGSWLAKKWGIAPRAKTPAVAKNDGLEYVPTIYLLMHAMGPNVAGVIGSAVAAGILLGFLM